MLETARVVKHRQQIVAAWHEHERTDAGRGRKASRHCGAQIAASVQRAEEHATVGFAVASRRQSARPRLRTDLLEDGRRVLIRDDRPLPEPHSAGAGRRWLSCCRRCGRRHRFLSLEANHVQASDRAQPRGQRALPAADVECTAATCGARHRRDQLRETLHLVSLLGRFRGLAAGPEYADKRRVIFSIVGLPGERNLVMQLMEA